MVSLLFVAGHKKRRSRRFKRITFYQNENQNATGFGANNGAARSENSGAANAKRSTVSFLSGRRGGSFAAGCFNFFRDELYY